MGCGASIPKQRLSRFSDPAKFNLDGLKFDEPPTAVVATQGLHPQARRLEEKRSAAAFIKNNQPSILMFASDKTKLECLFVYPEFSQSVGKPPAKCFGKLGSQVKVEFNGAKVDFMDVVAATAASGVNQVANAVSSAFSAIKSAAADLIMTDADDHIPTAPSVPAGSDDGDAANSGLPEGTPNWQGVVCQLKEFDTPNDVAKPWFRDAAGGVPGLLRLETAGASAAWATLQPHIYQQRWVLPNERRAFSFADEEPSVVQRIDAAYKALGGDKWLTELLNAVEDARKSIPVELLVAGFDTAELAFILNPRPDNKDHKEKRDLLVATEKALQVELPKLLQVLAAEIKADRASKMLTVHQLPDELSSLRTMLGHVENAMVFNWFRVGVFADVEVSKNYFMKSDPKGAGSSETDLHDWVMGKVLNKAESLGDEAFKEAKKELGLMIETALETVLTGADSGMVNKLKAKAHAKALFTDLDEIAKEDAECMEMNIEGLVSRFAGVDPAFRKPEEIDELLKQWEAADARPFAERRGEHYKTVMESFVKRIKDAGNDFDKINIVADSSRFPFLMPRHFADFEFVLVFPKTGTGKGPFKRPAVAELCLWPESHRPGLRKVAMNDLYIPNGGPNAVSKIAEKAADLFDDGDDSIDSSSDPRQKWGPYPNAEWRGFTCTLRVALDVIYGFNFLLDGVSFLDSNSFDLKHPDREYYRRVKFTQRAGPYVYNPLIDIGVAAA